MTAPRPVGEVVYRAKLTRRELAVFCRDGDACAELLRIWSAVSGVLWFREVPS